jgi:hypothetical protein
LHYIMDQIIYKHPDKRFFDDEKRMQFYCAKQKCCDII